MTTKPCKDCGEVKELEEFNKHPHPKDGRSNVCKICQAIRTKEWRNKHPKRVKLYTARWTIKRQMRKEKAKYQAEQNQG